MEHYSQSNKKHWLLSVIIHLLHLLILVILEWNKQSNQKKTSPEQKKDNQGEKVHQLSFPLGVMLHS